MTSHEKIHDFKSPKPHQKCDEMETFQSDIYKIVNVCFGINKMMEAACKIEGICDI